MTKPKVKPTFPTAAAITKNMPKETNVEKAVITQGLYILSLNESVNTTR
ncbi:hypothetical protein [Microscilla marina]|nr:hypothetical protein [Microscilla marina]